MKKHLDFLRRHGQATNVANISCVKSASSSLLNGSIFFEQVWRLGRIALLLTLLLMYSLTVLGSTTFLVAETEMEEEICSEDLFLNKKIGEKIIFGADFSGSNINFGFGITYAACGGQTVPIHYTISTGSTLTSIVSSTGTYSTSTNLYQPSNNTDDTTRIDLVIATATVTSTGVPCSDTARVEVPPTPVIQVPSSSNNNEICFGNFIKIVPILGGGTTDYVVSVKSGNATVGSGADYNKTNSRYTPSVVPTGISRSDTLTFTPSNPSSSCSSIAATYIVKVFSKPIFELSSDGFVKEGNSIKIDTTVGGGATSFIITAIKQGAALGAITDFNRTTSSYTPGTINGFYRNDTIFAESRINSVAGLCPKKIALPITVFRASSISISTMPLNTQLICALDSLRLQAMPMPSSETEVIWKSLNNMGIFSDSLNINTEYYPNSLSQLSGRIDQIEATLIELRPVEWINGTNVSTASSTQLERTTGTGDWGGAGARSKFEIGSGENGFVELRISSDEDVAVGLSTVNTSSAPNTSNDYTTINYGLFQDATNKIVYAIENGVPVSSSIAYVALDKFRVERVGNTIFYKKNKIVFHQSTTNATNKLFVDAAIQNLNGKITAVTSILPDGATVAKDTFSARINFSPILDLGTDTVSICHGDSVLLNIDINPSNIKINSEISANGTFNISTGVYTPNSNFSGADRIDILIAQTELLGSCASGVDTLFFKVAPRDSTWIMTPSPTGNVCESDSLDLEGVLEVGTTAILWTTKNGTGSFKNADSLITKYAPNPITSDDDTRIDTVIITTIPLTTSGCKPFSDTIEVLVSRQPTITVSQDTTICQDNNATLRVSLGGNTANSMVSWAKVNNGSESILVSPTMDTTYMYSPAPVPNGMISRKDTLIGISETHATCSESRDTVIVTVYKTPNVDVSSSPLAICGGSSDTIRINSSTFEGAMSVHWEILSRHSGRGIISNSNALKAVYTPNDIVGTATVRMDTLLVITDDSGACEPDTAYLAVAVSRSAQLTPIKDTVVCENTNLNLMTILSTTDPNSNVVTWMSTSSYSSSSFTPFAGTGTGAGAIKSITYQSSLPIAGVQYTDTVRYFSQDPAGVCPMVEDTVLITIFPNQILEIIDPAPSATGGSDLDTVLLCRGDNLPLSVKTQGTIPQVIWSSTNGTFTNSNDTSTVYIPQIDTAATDRIDTIFVESATFTGCAPAKDTLIVVIAPAPILTQSSDSVRICSGNDIRLNAIFSRSSTTYWSLKDAANGALSNINANSATYTPTGIVSGIERADIIYLKSDSTISCPATMDSLVVFIVANPILELGPDQTLCANTGNIISIQSLGDGNQLNLYGANGSVNSDNSYMPTSLIPAVNRQDIIYGEAVDAFGVCPSVFDEMVVRITEAVEIFPADSTAICESDTLVLDPSYAGLPSYFTANITDPNGQVILLNDQVIFVPGKNISDVARTDRIIITNNTNAGVGICTEFSDTVFINVLNSPEAELVADTTVCEGATTNLLVSTFGIQNIYESKYSNSLVNYPNLPIGNITRPLIDTVVYGTFTNNGCGNAIDTVIVTIQPVGDFTLALEDTTICESNRLALNAGLTDNTLKYNWTVLGDKGTFDNEEIRKPVYSPNMGLTTAVRLDTIILKVEKNNNICFTSSDTMVVTVIQGVTFSPLPDTAICAGENLTVDLGLSGTVDLNWVSSNGTFSNSSTAMTTYTPNPLTGNSRIDTLHADLTFADGGCADTRETMLLVIYNSLPIDAGVDTSICAGFDFQLDGRLGLGLNEAIWTILGGEGTFNDSSKLNAIYTPNPIVGTTERVDTLVLNTSNGLSCLTGADTILLTIKLEPTADLGADQTVFNGTNVPLMAILNEKAEVGRWSSNNGSFLNSGLDISTYIPSDLGNLESRIDRVIYEASFSNATCVNVKDTLFIIVVAPPTISRSGNSAFCESICLDTAFVNIDRNTGTVVVLANNIDPFDTCQVRTDLDLKFWYSALGTAEPTTVMDFPALPNNITYDCNMRGTQNLNVYVAEDSMNIQLCPIIVQVEDVGLTCGERMVSGQITTVKGEPVVGFDVFVEDLAVVGGVVPDPVKTDANGRYSIILDVGREYRIVPKNNEDLAMGVTAFDNVVISRHILGLQSFDSPFQTIAADVNKSGTVTAFDIVLIRKVVLARDDQFFNNTSWRFIDANYVFEDIGSAASAPFMESFVVEPNTGNISDMDFIAVKTGDANSTVNPNGLTSLSDDRNASKNRLLETDNLTIEEGQIYEVPFRFIDGKELHSYQFTMNFAGLELLDIQGGIVTPEHFGQTMTKRGLLTAAWSAVDPVVDDRSWFTLKFKANKSGVLSEMLSLNSIVTPIEAVTTDDENVGIQLTFVQSNSTALQLFQNQPNPFKNETTISFALPESGIGEITVLDMQGRVFRTIKGDYSAGYNEVQVSFTDLPRGVFYYRLETAHGTRVQKMMRVE